LGGSRVLPAWLLSLLCFVAPPVCADWISLSGAENSPTIIELHVETGHVRLVVEVYRDDRGSFADLLGQPAIDASDITPLQILADGIVLTGEIGTSEIRARIDRASPFKNIADPSRIPFSRPPEYPNVSYVEVIYPFPDKQQRPKFLTIIPPMKPSAYPSATIGFIAFHSGVPVIDFRYLSGAERLQLSWEDPWYSSFENPNLTRHHKSALMSFLYVEPYEVRHEVLVRVKELSNWVDLELPGDFLEADQLAALKSRVGSFLLERNPVFIDGQPARPILDRINFVSVGLSGIQILEQPQRLDAATAVVGVIIAFITDGMPEEVIVDWELFSDEIRQVPTSAIDLAGPFASYVTPEDNRLVWKNFLQNYQAPTIERVKAEYTGQPRWWPVGLIGMLAAILLWRGIRRSTVISGTDSEVRRKTPVAGTVIFVGTAIALIAGIGLYSKRQTDFVSISPAEAERVFSHLLRNVYRAFDFRQESDIYNKLAVSVTGDLLADVYLNHRSSMEIENQGGARARVEDVKLESISALGENPGEGAAYRCVWVASGSVGHWGHVHRRTNRYEAVLNVAVFDGVWKLTGMDLMDERRIIDAQAGDQSASRSSDQGSDQSTDQSTDQSSSERAPR